MIKKISILLLIVTAFSVKSIAQDELSLNKGSRWLVDQPTAINVAALRQIVKADHKATLAGYLTAGDDLQKGIEKMIRECRMKGKAHQSLHHWLEPLMNQVARLREAKDKTTALGAYRQARNQLALFKQYFKS